MMKMKDKAVKHKHAILLCLKYNNNRVSSRQLLNASGYAEVFLAQLLDELKKEGKIRTEFRDGKVEVIKNE